jgi:hypothetical protein
MKKIVIHITQILAWVCVGVAVFNTNTNEWIRYIMAMISLIFISITNYAQGINDGINIGNKLMNSLVHDGILTVNEEQLKKKAKKVK